MVIGWGEDILIYSQFFLKILDHHDHRYNLIINLVRIVVKIQSIHSYIIGFVY